jgi:predicted nucleic acid-binding protein
MLNAVDALWTCRAIDLEVAYSVRSRDVARAMARRSYLKEAPIGEREIDRAVEIAVAMAEAGLHRHAKSMDLIIAAAAEAAGLTVLHYDHDFDHIASVTGKPTEWVSPPGSLD